MDKNFQAWIQSPEISFLGLFQSVQKHNLDQSAATEFLHNMSFYADAIKNCLT